MTPTFVFFKRNFEIVIHFPQAGWASLIERKQTRIRIQVPGSTQKYDSHNEKLQ